MSEKTAPAELTTAGCAVLWARLALVAVMIAWVLYCLLLFAAQFSPGLEGVLSPPPRVVGLLFHAPLSPLLGLLRDVLGTRPVANTDIAPLITAALVILVRALLDSALAPPPEGATRGRAPRAPRPGTAPPHPAEATRAPAATVPAAPAVARPDSHMDLLRQIAEAKKRIETSTGKEREQALAEIADAQAQLAAQKKPLTFMALDVVGSTKMKAGQHKVIVEHAFLSFREWVEEILGRHRAWKSSWTPDGAMIAFQDVNEGAQSAREILEGLPRFNKEGHEMDVPFQVRLGLSQGEVLFPDKAEMTEVTDQVIDLAGHLQKYASPDSLLVAKHDLAKLRDRNGFRTTHQRVDGFDVLEWSA